METSKPEYSTEFPVLPFNPYASPSKSRRSTPIFRLHHYPTKIDYRSIVPFILAHTSPGDTVYDSFAGTCSTAIAAAACAEADPLLLDGTKIPPGYFVEWGARKSISVDIGHLPTFIGGTMLNPIDTHRFREAFEKVMSELHDEWSWLYEAEDDFGRTGILRHQILSDVMKCPSCASEYLFIDAFVDFKRKQFNASSRCPECGKQIHSVDERATENYFDDLLDTERVRFKRRPVLVYGKTGSRFWQRRTNESDARLEIDLADVNLRKYARPMPILGRKGKWGEMYRSGYHRFVTHVHDFYTRRNFVALAILYGAAERLPLEMQNHFRLMVSSYNVSHSSLMTRFVFKEKVDEPVVTSGEPGALYISGCPVEKNVFAGVRRKLKDHQAAMGQVAIWNPEASVRLRPAQSSGLAPSSIDYIFTDPPFAGNIQYSELNYLSEVWLDGLTEPELETVVSKTQAKGLEEYESLLREAFRENFRVLKPGHYMTVVFHNASSKVWNALRRTLVDSGFQIIYTSILDKEQKSFKQTMARGSVRKDVILGALKSAEEMEPAPQVPLVPKEFVISFLSSLDASRADERTSDFIFSRYVGECMKRGLDVPLDAEDFKGELESVAFLRQARWYVKPSVIVKR